MNPVLTVIIPVYNAEKWLPRCIDSIVAQSFTDMEIVLIDDGSTDSSLNICRQYAAKDDRIRVISQSNQGVSIARNKGMECANGQYVTFVDADDYIEPDAFAAAINYVIENNLDVVAYGMFFDYFKNDKLARSETRSIKEDMVAEKQELGTYFYYLYDNNYLSSACNKIYRNSLIVDNKLTYDTNMAHYEDLAFVLDILYKSNRFGALKRPLYHYCQDLSLYHIWKRPEIDYIQNFKALSEKLLILTSALGLNGNEDIKKISGFIFRFYLLGLEKIVSQKRPAGLRYREFKHYYFASPMRNAITKAKCHGYKLNLILLLFKWQFLLGVFLLLYLNDLYIKARALLLYRKKSSIHPLSK